MNDYYDISVSGFTDDLGATIESLVGYMLKRIGEAANPSPYEELLEVLEGLALENDIVVVVESASSGQD